MPELPEVETIRRGLEPHLLGQRISAVNVLRPSQLHNVVPEVFCSQLVGTIIQRLERRGKYLLFFCSPGLALIIHLRMTGQLIYYPQGNIGETYTRLILSLESKAQLHFRDLRALGQITLVTTAKLSAWKPLAKLGPEPLSTDFTLGEFQTALKRRRAPIKNVLLAQQVVAGLGNIYADESLFQAGINPLHPSNALSLRQSTLLWKSIRKTLAAAIGYGGTTISDYVNAGGTAGSFQQQLLVYGRKGQSCNHCGTRLVGCRLAGRSTVYCPRCQPL
ncbi:MAG TPA: bifunctional DNA-formamidopyrimidine glycosylase/DNA-(apurinic or apyrimidinic site) lyase [bacterium]|jgi:formamidopyrimidine-DNA glycosylase|nr:bifunctional DNA-formamidopyrimidine glycosylase/DNA-(apurinic or apyrimidinic site) lyase [bacterium]